MNIKARVHSWHSRQFIGTLAKDSGYGYFLNLEPAKSPQQAAKKSAALLRKLAKEFDALAKEEK